MAATKGSASSPMCNLAVLDTLSESSVGEMANSWNVFCEATETLLRGDENLSFASDIGPHVRNLCGLGLQSLVVEHFLCSVEKIFEKNGASRFWMHFEAYRNLAVLDMEDLDQQGEMQDVLHTALERISSEKQYHEKCLLVLVHALEMCRESTPTGKGYSDAEQNYLLSKYHLTVSSVLMASIPRHFHDVLQCYFKGRLEELSTMMAAGSEYDSKLNVDDEGDLDCRRVEMDIDGTHYQKTILGNNRLVKKIGEVVRDLRNLGFTSLAEDAYASAIFLLLKAKVHELAGDDFMFSVLDSIKQWIQDVPLHFLHALLAYLGDSKSYGSPSSGFKSPLVSHPYFRYCGNEVPSEGLVRWKLRLEYFAYETLQDLRIAKLFEIIVDYPDSSPAIEDLKQCLEYTGQHSKLVDSFIAALKYRLLTAGASTNDILHQYVSTIKALRTIDPAGVFLEAVGEPIREYLKGRKDTIKCIVTMLTDGASGNPTGPGSTGDSLLEELNRDEENQESSGFDDDVYTDDKQAWINAQSWEPDPVEADPLKGSRYRRKVDILGVIVGIIGSKDQLVNEYRVMLAEKLLNKSDYDIDSEIRTLELLKIHFGEGSMQKCEIMLNDLIDSKRTNTNIKSNYMSAGQISVPIVFRGPNGAAAGVGAQHSQCYAAWYGSCPGLKVLAPYSAEDARGLLKAAIRDPDPVVFLENELLYGESFPISAEVLDSSFCLPIGKAKIEREGKDVTITAFSKMVGYSVQAADILAKEGINAEVINLRSIRPLDRATINASVRKTSRLVTVEEGFPQHGVGAEICASVIEDSFEYLDAPVERIAGADVPTPYAANLERMAFPQVDDIVRAAKRACYRSR